MNYLLWSLVAVAAYTFVAPLMSVATTGDVKMPSDVGALLANTILVVATAGVIVFGNGNFVGYVGEYLTHPKAPYVYAAGVCLAIGILAYYRALALGPVSIVAPVFGMFLVTSSVIGILFLDEAFTARKALGIGFAVVAVYLVSVE
ncbi:EamA family transporter [Halobium salinum]|uniref:EamA family transporter n=1 Tax=Halobium salinum TaxID=1364940 RepID=A0ABD5P7Z4_9EURY|nr:EamA family transporter [Halobium salinum]